MGYTPWHMKRRVVEMPPAQEPRETNPFSAALLAAELGGPSYRLDLHGLNEDQAIDQLERAVFRLRKPDENVLKIIHGRGGQKLHDAVHEWLAAHPQDVALYQDASKLSQAGGVTYAVLY